MPQGRAASIDGGVLVNLKDKNQIVINDEKTEVLVGPGARWQDVYASLVPHGLMIVGGRVGEVGVGGLALGGK